MDASEQVRAFYAALDEHEYERLETLLSAGFTHERPDQTLDSRERFVTFMRDERPLTETTHALRTVVTDGTTGVAEGRLLDADGTELFNFVDVHEIDDGRIETVRTYTK